MMAMIHSPFFAADSTLGKLARWLRLAGFDTLYDRRPPDAANLAAAAADRIILTRSRAVAHALSDLNILFIRYDQPLAQARQVMHELGLDQNAVRPLTRCAECNADLSPISRADAQGRVPDYILQTQSVFHLCPRCRRIYWPGSHVQRWSALMERWFVP